MEAVRCDDCHWKYPESLLHRMFVNGTYTKPICAICALALMNEVHGMVQESFPTRMAEAARKAAIRWRELHPADQPVVN